MKVKLPTYKTSFTYQDSGSLSYIFNVKPCDLFHTFDGIDSYSYKTIELSRLFTIIYLNRQHYIRQ